MSAPARRALWALALAACAPEVVLTAPASPAAVRGEAPDLVLTPPYGDERARLEVHVGPGFDLERAAIARWVEAASAGVVGYFGRFPVPELVLEVRPSPRAGVVFGTAYGGASPWIFVDVGRHATPADLAEDWVLVHELIHIASPQLDDRHRWAMEGLATWVEPFIRHHQGAVSAERLWQRFVERMPFGLPAAGDRGLDHTATWGRTYWGGALFWMIAELDARAATGGRHGLRTALAAILAAGGDKRRFMKFEEALAQGDEALGADVLVPLAARWCDGPVDVDLEALWARLGVWRDGDRVVLDDAAPDAALRRLIERQAD